jgi:hypothetical protein
VRDTESNDLARFLTSNDIPCPCCGYNLRGLTSDACPECNQPLVLRVGLAEPRVGSLVAAASGFLAGAGAALVCLALVVLFSIREKSFPTGREFGPIVLLPLLCLLIEGALATLLLRLPGRRWFRGLNPYERATMIALGWVLTGIAVVTFFVTVR